MCPPRGPICTCYCRPISHSVLATTARYPPTPPTPPTPFPTSPFLPPFPQERLLRLLHPLGAPFLKCYATPKPRNVPYRPILSTRRSSAPTNCSRRPLPSPRPPLPATFLRLLRLHTHDWPRLVQKLPGSCHRHDLRTSPLCRLCPCVAQYRGGGAAQQGCVR